MKPEVLSCETIALWSVSSKRKREVIMRWRKISVAAAMAAAITAGITFTLGGTSAQAQGNLRIGMTANDVPLTWGQPDNGFEGYRYMGLLVYDSLINWDLTSADKPSSLIPGLAESWEVD
jgi:ABC-type transport system substrate-binding protein